MRISLGGLPHITSSAMGGGGVHEKVTLNDMGGRGVHRKVTSFKPIISDLDPYIKSLFEEVY